MTPLEDGLILGICLLAGCFAGYYFFVATKMNDLKSQIKAQDDISKDKLALTAYERLLLYADRSSINNLSSRLFEPSLTARQMQQAMVMSIRAEYDHNITQQLYVKPAIWDAVSKLKDQNIYMINEVSRLLPEDASAKDLNRQLLELVMHNERATLNKTVAEAITFEVQQNLLADKTNA